MSNKNGLKVLIGVAIGTAIGACIAYFSDEEKRNKFIDDMSDKAERAGESLKDVYYEGRIRARKAGRDLSRRFADAKEDAQNALNDAMDSALNLGRKSRESFEELAELTKEELEEMKKEALKEGKEISKNLKEALDQKD